MLNGLIITYFLPFTKSISLSLLKKIVGSLSFIINELEGVRLLGSKTNLKGLFPLQNLLVNFGLSLTIV